MVYDLRKIPGYQEEILVEEKFKRRAGFGLKAKKKENKVGKGVCSLFWRIKLLLSQASKYETVASYLFENEVSNIALNFSLAFCFESFIMFS